MNHLKDFIKSHQQKLVLMIGYALVAALGFGLGQLTTADKSGPQIRVEQAFLSPSNYTAKSEPAQLAQAGQVLAQSASQADTCQGKIKGSSSFTYHVPGGAFYDRTTKPIRCFDTEAQAQAAGFKKSNR